MTPLPVEARDLRLVSALLGAELALRVYRDGHDEQGCEILRLEILGEIPGEILGELHKRKEQVKRALRPDKDGTLAPPIGSYIYRETHEQMCTRELHWLCEHEPHRLRPSDSDPNTLCDRWAEAYVRHRIEGDGIGPAIERATKEAVVGVVAPSLAECVTNGTLGSMAPIGARG